MDIYRSNGEKITEKQMVSIIKNFINEKNYFEYRCLIGTDSQTFISGVKYVTSIVIHRVGNGAIAFYIYHFDKGNFLVKRNKHNLLNLISKRMFQEATFTLDYARNFLEKTFLSNHLFLNICVHFDISEDEKEKTSLFKNSIVGMAKSYGFTEDYISIKPYALAAQSIANKKTKKLS